MRNIEKLRSYFLGKDPQLKETMADNSLRLIGIEGKHFVLRTELLKRLQELRKHVDDKDKELQDAIDDLIHDLSLEETAREDADRDLQLNIDAEANTRSTNDGLLQGQLNMLTPRVAGAEQDIDNLEAKSFFNVLTEDLNIPEAEEVTSLTESGWYYTGEHQIYYGNNTDDAVVYTQAIFYFYADSGDQWFCFFPPKMENGWDQICSYLWFDNIENKWVYDGIDITSSTAGISDQSTDNSVPTSKAVFDFVENELPENFVGTTGIDNGQAGLVPAPQTSDMGKYLNADGSWKTVAVDTYSVEKAEAPSSISTGTITSTIKGIEAPIELRNVNSTDGFMGVEFAEDNISTYVCDGTEVQNQSYYFTDYQRLGATHGKWYRYFIMPPTSSGDVFTFDYNAGKTYLNGSLFTITYTTTEPTGMTKLLFSHNVYEPSGDYTTTISNSDNSESQTQTVTWPSSLYTSIVQDGDKYYFIKRYEKIASYNGETLGTGNWTSTLGDLVTGATVYYAITPERTEITDSTLLAALDGLNGMHTYDGNTTVTTTSVSNHKHFFRMYYKRTAFNALAAHSQTAAATYEAKSNKLSSTQAKSTSDTSYPSCGYMFKHMVNGNSYITDVWKGTQAEYNLITNPSSTTLYIIE